MKNIIFSFMLLSLPLSLFSQTEGCGTAKEENLEDDVTAVAKCSFKSDSKHKSALKVNVSSNKRYLKRRTNLMLAKSKLSAFSSTLSMKEVKSSLKFSEVDLVPTFANCVDDKSRLECFNKEMANHIEKYFNYPEEAVIKKIEGQVWVRFVIDKNGNVTNIMARAPKGGEVLKEEAMRVVSHLPKFKPAMVKGEPAVVKYGFPITFNLAD